MRWTLLAAACIVLAGCTDGPVIEPTDLPEDDDEGGGLALLTIPGAVPFQEARSFSGTFQFQDSEDISAPLREAGIARDTYQFHDISDILPVGMPVEMFVTVEGTGSGDIDIWLEGGVDYWDWQCDCPLGPDNEHLFRIRADEPVQIGIQYDEHGQEAAFRYDIEVLVVSDPFTAIPAMPLAVRLAEGEHIVVRNHTAPVLIFDASDAVVAILDGQDDGYVAARGGEYVVIGADSGDRFEILTDGQEPRQRVLRHAWEMEPFTISGTGVEADARADEGVINVGYCVFGGDFTMDPSVVFAGPGGTLAFSAGAGPHLLGSWGNCWDSPTADPSIGPGEYTLEFTREHGEGGDGFIWITWFER